MQIDSKFAFHKLVSFDFFIFYLKYNLLFQNLQHQEESLGENICEFVFPDLVHKSIEHAEIWNQLVENVKYL